MSNVILFKDMVQDKNIEELMQLLPCMVCIESTIGDYVSRSSYTVLGFGSNCVILGDYPDNEFECGSCLVVPFDKLNQRYIYCHEPTSKQKEWLRRNCIYRTVSGYEAWHIIHDAVEEGKQRAAERKRQSTVDVWGSWDDWDPMDCDLLYDLPNT